MYMIYVRTYHNNVQNLSTVGMFKNNHHGDSHSQRTSLSKLGDNRLQDKQDKHFGESC